MSPSSWKDVERRKEWYGMGDLWLWRMEIKPPSVLVVGWACKYGFWIEMDGSIPQFPLLCSWNLCMFVPMLFFMISCFLYYFLIFFFAELSILQPKRKYKKVDEEQKLFYFALIVQKNENIILSSGYERGRRTGAIIECFTFLTLDWVRMSSKGRISWVLFA